MPVPPFPQRKESELLSWSTDFLALITASAARFGVTEPQVLAYQTLHDAFASSYAVAINTNTNSKANVEIKNNAKQALLNGPGGAWALVNIMQAAPNMDNDKRVELNIRVPDSDPTPVPIPTERPNIDVVAVNAYTITVRLHGDGIKGKPAKVKGTSIFTHVGASAPADMTGWTFQRNTTKNSAQLTVPSTTAPGALVWVTAFWFNNRMQSGPATLPPISVNIPGVMSMAA